MAQCCLRGQAREDVVVELNEPREIVGTEACVVVCSSGESCEMLVVGRRPASLIVFIFHFIEEILCQ